MNNQQIQSIFEKTYSRNNWKQVLNEVAGVNNFYTGKASIEVQSTYKNTVKNAIELGHFSTTDKMLVGLYEIELDPVANVQLYRNKIGMRELLKSVYKNSVDAALVVFFHKNKWRLSLISETKNTNTTPKRFTYLLGENEICKTAAERFEKLGGEFSLNELIDAFSVEKVSNEFFVKYKEIYLDFVEHFTGERIVKQGSEWKTVVKRKVENHEPLIWAFKNDKKLARDFCKKLLGRIVFLYFVQKKKWLGASNTNYIDGDEKFMRTFFEQGKKQGTFSLDLHSLFFDTLNNSDRKEDNFKMPNGSAVKIPFLNGGLFENDLGNISLDIPDNLFDTFFNFLDGYNFTIDESTLTDQTIGIDPNMLGHIFENLLEDNKEKGAFYTPKEIVYYMCKEVLNEYLKDKEDEEKALENIKICDPAIGSGAFPMGLLHEIFEKKQAIYQAKRGNLDGFDSYQIKLDIIQKNIYGVDIEKGAVDIARLRFWLSLVIDLNKPQPLPNLDFKIVEGNSLASIFNKQVIEINWNVTPVGQGLLIQNHINNINNLLTQITNKQKNYFNTKGNKIVLSKEINNLKIDLLVNQLQVMINSTSSQHSKQDIIFWRDCIGKLNHIKSTDKRLDFFDWTLDFPDVMNPKIAKNRIGFDIVIGNPPYISALEASKNMEESIRKEYKKKYESAVGTYDIYILFFEQGLKIMNYSGTMIFITPIKYVSAKYAEAFRTHFSSKHLKKIVSFSNDKVFENAGVSASISKFKLNDNSDVISEIYSQSDFKNPIIRKYPRLTLTKFPELICGHLLFGDYKIVSNIYTTCSLLEEVTTINGSSTANEADEFANYVSSTPNTISKKIINTGNNAKYINLWGIKEYSNRRQKILTPYLDVNNLSQKKQKRLNQYNTTKIIVSKLAKSIIASFDENGEFASTNTSFIYDAKNNISLKIIVAILNSNLMNFIYKTMFSGMNLLGSFQFQPPQLRILPIPTIDGITKKIKEKIEKLVDKILLTKKKNPTADTSDLENQIDICVYKLYDLSYADVKIIDPNFSLEEEEYETTFHLCK